jgi:septal ring factor EnvC (AmiA/AmiB activator)
MSGRTLNLALSLLIATTCAAAQVPDTQRTQENLEAVEEQLETSQDHERALAVEVANLIRQQEELSAKLVAAADEVTLRQKVLGETGDRVSTLDAESAAIRKELLARREILAEILAGLQRLEQNPPPALVVAPGRILDALRSAMMFGAVVPQLRSEAERLANKLARLDSIRLETADERRRAELQFTALEQSRDELAALLVQRRALLKDNEVALANARRRVKELAARATNLRQLLAVLAQQKTGASQQETAREVEEALRRSAMNRPATILAKSVGKLEYPVQGRILARFGESNGIGGALSGLAIAAEAKSLVRAPSDASVVFAGPFRSYGQLLILDAGEGYFLLLAGMSQVDVSLGQRVRAGEPLGAMGEKGAPATLVSAGLSGGRAVLYVEIRKNGEPADSNEWWIGSRKEKIQ